MKKLLSLFFAGTLFIGTLLFILPLNAQASEHPRLDAAIEKLEDAVAYLKEAPHNFGGHKAAAIADCQKAIKQLKKAIRYREKKK